MTAVIKSTSSSTAMVRAFASPRVVAASIDVVPQPDPERIRLETDLAAALDELGTLRKSYAEIEAAIPRIEDKARARGVEEGLAQAKDDAVDRSRAVAAGIDKALMEWDERLADIDVLAAMLARRGLAKIFGQDAEIGDLALRSISHQLSALRDCGVLAVRVSEQDFAETGARDRLDKVVGAERIAFDPALKSGECRIELRLGEADAGVISQWRQLDAFLEALA